MHAVLKFTVFSLMAVAAQSALADGGSYQSHDSIADGSAGAKLGTTIYNSLNPKNPLPVQGGDAAVVTQTVTNMGMGQNPKQAYKNAAESAAGSTPPSDNQ